MLFSKRDKDETAPKRRSTLVKMLSPGFGNSLRPIGESTRIFVNLIAMLFAMNGLFPKNHPAFAYGGNNPEVRLTLHEVIATAWTNLSFTEKNTPQILFFFAVVATMALTAFAAIIAIFSLFVATAHAATTSSGTMFTPPANDLAQNWIDYIFQGLPLATTYNTGGNATVAGATGIQNINIQCAMMTALGYYSNAILMVGAIILFYHLATMVVETAHHGQVMGKRANQIWAPIRLVVAVGLLVPLGGNGPAACGTSGAGLNSAQYITIKIAELGSALASNTWATFVKTLVGENFNFIEPPLPKVDDLVHNVFEIYACMNAWNYFSSPLNPTGTGPEQVIMQDVPQAMDEKYVYGPVNIPAVPANICGAIEFPNPPQASNTQADTDALQQSLPQVLSIVQAISQAQRNTLVNTMLPEIQNDVLVDYVPMISDLDAAQNGDNPPKNNGDFQKAVNDYISTLRGNLAGSANPSTLNPALLTSVGWIGAGIWMNVLANDQGEIIDTTNDALPKAFPPSPAQLRAIGTPLGTSTAEVLDNFDTWLLNGYTIPTLAAAPSPCSLEGMSGTAGVNIGNDEDPGIKSIVSNFEFDKILKVIDGYAVSNHLWSDVDYKATCPNTQPFFSLGAQFVTANPLLELAAYGKNSMNVSIQMFNEMLSALLKSQASSVAGGLGGMLAKGLGGAGKIVGIGIGGVAGAYGAYNQAWASFYGFMAVIFLTIGVTLGYIVPLIPFVHFFFAAIAWGLVLLEGVVAMPLVALAHLNPEGDGLPSGMAKQAYFMLLGLFMRPVLIIFGYIIGLLIFMMSMIMLNKLYGATVVASGGLDTGHATISRIIYTVIYVFLAYTCATNCFKVVDNLPESVFRWVSIQLGHQKIADGGSAMQQAGGIVTAVAGQQLVSNVQQASLQINTGLK